MARKRILDSIIEEIGNARARGIDIDVIIVTDEQLRRLYDSLQTVRGKQDFKTFRVKTLAGEFSMFGVDIVLKPSRRKRRSG